MVLVFCFFYRPSLRGSTVYRAYQKQTEGSLWMEKNY